MADSFIDVSRRVIEHPTAHLRVLGPPGSGKTRLLAERFRALEARLRGIPPDPGQRNPRAPRTECRDAPGDQGGVFILTYSTESHKRLTDAVFGKNTARLGPAPVLTYTRLAQEIIEESRGRPPVFVPEFEERLLLENVIENHEKSMKSELRSICRTDRFVDDALEAIHILVQNGVGEEALDGMARHGTGNPELSDLLTLYREFRLILELENAVTYYGVSWTAVKCLRAGGVSHPLMKASAILVEDFQDIDAGQFELLRSIAPPDGPVAVNVFGDPLGSVFAHRGTQHAYLADEFPRLYTGETFFLPARTRPGGAPEATIEALLTETLGEESRAYLPVVSSGEGSPGEMRLEIARDEVDEVWTVAAQIASILRRPDREPEEITVIANNKRSYEPILAAAATQRGIPLDTGRARKGVFGDFTDAFLTLVESPGDPVASRAIVTSPLFPWLQRLFSSPPSGASDASRDAEDLRAFVGEIRREIAGAAVKNWMPIIAVRVLEPLSASLAGETGNDSVYEETSALLDAWDRYADAVERRRLRASLGGFAAMESRLWSRRTPGATGCVSFLSPREAKGRYFPQVFVLGCSELLFPSAARNENILPLERLQEALREVFPDRVFSIHAARSAAKQLVDEHHLLYIALTRASESLCITAPAIFGGEDYPAPSAVLERTIPTTARAQTPPEEKTPPQIRFARMWVEGSPGARGVALLDRLSPAGAQWHAVRPDAVPLRLEPFRLSKSTIETFVGCERRFFYRKALRVPEIDNPAAKVGTLLHDVMKDLGLRFPSVADLLASCTPEIVNEAIGEALRKDDAVGHDSFFERSLRHHLAVMVGWILDLEREDPEPRTIAETEYSIDFERGPWLFTGKIDRIDVSPAGEKTIVDYKSGHLNRTGKDLRKKTLYAIDRPKDANWQVPLYVWGMKTVEGSSPRAFVHLVAKTGEEPLRITLFICPREEDVPARARKEKRMSYLLEGEIEEIMERVVKVAEEIFAPRTRFERTDDREECQFCDFARICGRGRR